MKRDEKGNSDERRPSGAANRRSSTSPVRDPARVSAPTRELDRGSKSGRSGRESGRTPTTATEGNRKRKVQRNRRLLVGLVLTSVVGVGGFGMAKLLGGSKDRPVLVSGLPEVERVKATASLQGMSDAFVRLSNAGVDCQAVAAEVRRVVGSPGEVASASGAGSDEGREAILQAVALLRQSLTACIAGDQSSQLTSAKAGSELLKRYGISSSSGASRE